MLGFMIQKPFPQNKCRERLGAIHKIFAFRIAFTGRIVEQNGDLPTHPNRYFPV